MKQYNITFKAIETAREECIKKKGVLKISKSYDTLIRVYDLIEDLKCRKADNLHLVKSIRMWVASYNKVKANFVANQLYQFLENCRVK